MADNESFPFKTDYGARVPDAESPGNGQFALARTFQKALGIFQARMGDAPQRPVDGEDAAPQA
jgi:hypothetical protein